MININYVQTDIPEKDLNDIVNGLNSLNIWNISNNPAYWSNSFIDADYIYRAHRPSMRIIEETGLTIQDIVTAEFEIKDTIFPNFFQVVKSDKIFNRVVSSPSDKICETITYLNGPLKNQTVIVYNNSDMYAIENLNNEIVYTLSTFWSYTKNPMYRGWFINKYFRKFA